MTTVRLDSRDDCKLMDQLERKILNSEWSYGGRSSSGRTLQDIWSSRSILGEAESLLEAFQDNHKRIVIEIYGLPKGTYVAGKTLPEFTELWSEFWEETCPVKPFRLPDKMICIRTFRFSERALEYYGQSNRWLDVLQAHVQAGQAKRRNDYSCV